MTFPVKPYCAKISETKKRKVKKENIENQRSLKSQTQKDLEYLNYIEGNKSLAKQDQS